MKIASVILVTVAIHCTAAATFIQEAGNAPGTRVELAKLGTPEADGLPEASDSHGSSRVVQEVLKKGINVEDHKAVSQAPQSLNFEITGDSAEPMDLSVHDESSEESSLEVPNVGTVDGPLRKNILGQSLGKALGIAKIKAGEMRVEQVAIDVRRWVKDHPWQTESYKANLETMTGPFDREFWGQSLGKALELAKSKAQELHLDQVAVDIERWVEEHPWQAAFYAASFVGFFAPEILSIPALEALGFGAAGVRAGSIAAKVQSVIGPIAARSVFAIWQSARMGGYGVANVNGGVRALIALTDAAIARCNPLEDCKGLLTGGEARSRGFGSMTIASAVLCGCMTGIIAAIV